MNTLCSTVAMLGLYQCESPVSVAVEQAFIEHIAEFGFSYGTQEEYLFRQNIFAEKTAQMEEINSTQDSFTVGYNQFTTMTDFEYKRMLGAKVTPVEKRNVEVLNTTALPAFIDWVKAGAVNAVKNQGQCGSCWAFSATCAIEGAHFLKTGTLLSLAEQQLVDCDTVSYGCNGGWQYAGFEYAEAHAQDLEKDYKYTAKDGKCRSASYKGNVNVKSYVNVVANSVAQLKAALVNGPVSVTIEADKYVFQGYTGGILNSSACGTSLDHAVTAVAYGTENGQEYFLIRNSWGASWGLNGYIKLAAVEGPGICGVQMDSLYPATN
jgi:C1A family cysteine protease